MVKTKTKHPPDLPLQIKTKISEIHSRYFLDDAPELVAINAPRALMQTMGEGWSQGIRWVISLPLYAAAPDLLEALEIICRQLEKGRSYAPGMATSRDFCMGDALNTARAAVAKAEGR